MRRSLLLSNVVDVGSWVIVHFLIARKGPFINDVTRQWGGGWHFVNYNRPDFLILNPHARIVRIGESNDHSTCIWKLQILEWVYCIWNELCPASSRVQFESALLYVVGRWAWGEQENIGVRGWVIVIRAITITSYITFILGIYIVLWIRLFKIENLYIVQIASHLPLGVTEGRARRSFKKG